MDIHSRYLQRSIQLASYGLGYVNSLPLVGWLFCHHHKIIKEGWLCNDKDTDHFFEDMHNVDQTGCVLYLSIDPTAFVEDHHILFSSITNAGIQEIVLPSVSAFMAKLSQKHNIAIRVIDMLDKEAKELNVRFHTTITTSRPYVVLKWAQTADGFIARSNYDSKWISNTHARKLVHQWRSQEHAIMVGTNTCIYDNPQLNVRNWNGKDPVRVVLDRHLRLPSSLHVFDGHQPTLCYNLTKASQQPNLQYVAVTGSVKEYANFLEQVLCDLAKRKIQSVFVEGGSQLLNLLLENSWWNEARVFQSTQCFSEGILAPVISHGTLVNHNEVENDQLLMYQNTNRK